MIHDGQVLIDKQLDDLREHYSLVLAPAGDSRQGKLQSLKGCLGVRRRHDVLHAVFDLDPADCRTLVERELGIRDAQCRSVSLEEMFVELMGVQS